MRRYSFVIVLILSVLLPFQAAASMLLSAHSCPQKLMVMDGALENTGNAAPDAEPMHGMDCCGDDTSDCHQMQDCHGCFSTVQMYSYSDHHFYFTLNNVSEFNITEPFIATLEPAGLWRPPTQS